MRTGFKLGDVRRGGLLAIAAALLFGASTPAAKAIIAGLNPLMLAGLLYLGSGLGLSAWRLMRRDGGAPKLTWREVPWLAATVLFGGVLGPALLMFGLTHISGSAASLLLTLEGVFTAVLAWIVFRETFNRRIGLGMAVIFAGPCFWRYEAHQEAVASLALLPSPAPASLGPWTTIAPLRSLTLRRRHWRRLKESSLAQRTSSSP